MTPREAAAYLEISISLVYDLVARRKIPHHRIGSEGRGKIILDRADVEEFKRSCRVEAKSTRTTPAPPRGRIMTAAEYAERRKRTKE